MKASWCAEEEKARQLGRTVSILKGPNPDGAAVVERLRADEYDLVILPMPAEESSGTAMRAVDERTLYILLHAHCRVFLAAAPSAPQEVVDATPSAS